MKKTITATRDFVVRKQRNEAQLLSCYKAVIEYENGVKKRLRGDKSCFVDSSVHKRNQKGKF